MAEPEVEDENEIVPVSPNLITPDNSDDEVPVASCHSLRGTDTRDLQMWHRLHVPSRRQLML